MKRIISTSLALAMIGSLVACGRQTSVSNETKAAKETTVTTTAAGEATAEVTTAAAVEKKEPKNVSLFPANGNLTSGTVGGWLGDIFAENGVILDVWAYSEDKFNAILASGDFPDVMFFDNTKCDLNAIIESGYLLDLNEYMDQLPAVKNNAELQSAIKFTQQYVTTGTDKLGVLPTKVGALQTKLNTGGTSLSLNWELYEQIGKPEITCLEDTIDVFKQMQGAFPVSETGVKSYAMHLYSGADKGYFAAANNILKLNGYNNATKELPYFVLANTKTNEYEYVLEDDGIYKYALKYYNTLYKEGLLDPDSITYDRATVMKMVEEGSTLAGWPIVPAYENAGFFPVYWDGMRVIFTGNNAPYGSKQFIGISSKCENVEAALALVNMFADADQCFLLKTGPEGELWQYDASGVPVLTEKGETYFNNGESVAINGETFALFNTPLVLNTGAITSFGKQYSAGGWPENLAAKNNSETAKKWKTFYGVEDFKDLLGDDCVEIAFDDDLDKFVEAPSDEQKLLFAAAQDILIEASWKMVYAETEADFEKIWSEAVAECEELGIKDLVEWRKGVLADAIAVKASLAN